MKHCKQMDLAGFAIANSNGYHMFSGSFGPKRFRIFFGPTTHRAKHSETKVNHLIPFLGPTVMANGLLLLRVLGAITSAATTSSSQMLCDMWRKKQHMHSFGGGFV
jgi:hypothetical protein